MSHNDPKLKHQLDHKTWLDFVLFFSFQSIFGQSWFNKYCCVDYVASLVGVQQGAGVGADVVVFVGGLVQIQRLSVHTDLHTAAVGR